MAAAPKKDDLKTRFEAAAAAAKQTKKRPDNATLLKLYSYLQAGDRRATSPANGRADSISSAARSTTRGRSSRA